VTSFFRRRRGREKSVIHHTYVLSKRKGGLLPVPSSLGKKTEHKKDRSAWCHVKRKKKGKKMQTILSLYLEPKRKGMKKPEHIDSGKWNRSLAHQNRGRGERELDVSSPPEGKEKKEKG